MTELKPCPFCGGEAGLFHGDSTDGYIKGTGYVEAFCGCCGARIREFKRDEAVSKWNKRTNPWHTGNPTEEGDYLVKTDVWHHDYPYYVLKWYKGGWYSAFDMNYPACPQHSVLKWQKIKETN